MCQFLGSKLCYTTAFHLAANGLNERFNRSLKVALKCQSSPELWYRNLSLVPLGLRLAIKEDMGCAAVGMDLMSSIQFPGEYFENSSCARKAQKFDSCRVVRGKHSPTSFAVC